MTYFNYNSFHQGVDGLGLTRPGLIKSLGLGSASSLEKKIKKELQEQGVMETDYGNEVSVSFSAYLSVLYGDKHKLVLFSHLFS